MRVNKAMLMIRLINRITAERDYWKEKVEAQLEGKPFVENERYERRKHKITRISHPSSLFGKILTNLSGNSLECQIMPLYLFRQTI